MTSAGHTLEARRALPREAPWWLRLRVRWQAEELDAELAQGRLPGEEPALALRAAQLTSEPERHRLACRLDDLVATARRPPWRTARIAPRPAEVLAAASDLAALAADLRAASSVRAQGVARASRLFSDGRLSGRTAGELRRCARWAAATL